MEKENAFEFICIVTDGLNPNFGEGIENIPPGLSPVTVVHYGPWGHP